MRLLWIDFLNSYWHDWRGSGQTRERLEDPEALLKFLERWQLDAAVPPSVEELAALKSLRATIRRMAEAMIAGDQPGSIDLAALNEAMAAGPVVRELATEPDGYQVRLMPVQAGWQQVMAEIGASFAQTLAEQETARVRICENPDCHWVFYDDTRNRAKRYCDEKACGNLMKVRRFRAKQKETRQV